MATKFDLCSRALLKLGANTISSFSDGSAEANICAGLYEPARDALLSEHPWSFATAQATLAKLVATPVADYDYAYQLPADFLRALSVGDSSMEAGRGVEYRINERRIHSNVDGIVLSYIFRPEESAFPPFFQACLVDRLASEISMPLTENTARTEALTKIAEMTFRRARLTDGQQQTPKRIQDFTLINARG